MVDGRWAKRQIPLTSVEKKRIIQEVKKELTCEAITLFTKLMDGDTTQQKAEYNDA